MVDHIGGRLAAGQIAPDHRHSIGFPYGRELVHGPGEAEEGLIELLREPAKPRGIAFFTGVFWILRGLAASVLLQRSWVQIVERRGFNALSVAVMASAGVLTGIPALPDCPVLHMAHRTAVHPADLSAQRSAEDRAALHGHTYDARSMVGKPAPSYAQHPLPHRASLVPERAVLRPACSARPPGGAAQLPPARRGDHFGPFVFSAVYCEVAP